MKTIHLSIFSLCVAASAAHAAQPFPGAPVAGLTADELALFNQGKALFEHDFTPQEGVGPLFNQRSCAACHFQPATGGSEGGTANNVTHFGFFDSGRFFASFEIGGPVVQKLSIAGDPQAPNCHLAPDVVPNRPHVITSLRHTPPVFGFGLIDAISDADILAWQGRKPWKHASVSGAANWGVEMEILRPYQAFSLNPARTEPGGAPRVGRFGWKSQTATLFQFTEEPFNIELGVTTPFFRRENTPTDAAVPSECLVATAQPNDTNSTASVPLYAFQAFVAPMPTKRTLQGEAGEVLFNAIGCAQCHRASFKTVKDYYAPMPDGSAKRIAALSNKTIYPYSDFLVHDMGESNNDHRSMGRASGTMWRTTPLWGGRFKTNYWHDGSATTIDQAIDRHDGEGAYSRDRYNALPQWQQDLVDRFLQSI